MSLHIIILPIDALYSKMVIGERIAFWPNCLLTVVATCFSAGVASCCEGVATRQIYLPVVVLTMWPFYFEI